MEENSLTEKISKVLYEVANISMGWGANHISELSNNPLEIETIQLKEDSFIEPTLLKYFRHIVTRKIDGDIKGTLVFAIPELQTEYIQERFINASDKTTCLRSTLARIIDEYARGFAQGLSSITKLDVALSETNDNEKEVDRLYIDPYNLEMKSKVFFSRIGPCFDIYFVTDKNKFIPCVVEALEGGFEGE